MSWEEEGRDPTGTKSRSMRKAVEGLTASWERTNGERCDIVVGTPIKSLSSPAMYSSVVQRPSLGYRGRTREFTGRDEECDWVTIPTPSDPGTAGKEVGLIGYVPSIIFLSAGFSGEKSHFTFMLQQHQHYIQLFPKGGVPKGGGRVESACDTGMGEKRPK